MDDLDDLHDLHAFAGFSIKTLRHPTALKPPRCLIHAAPEDKVDVKKIPVDYRKGSNAKVCYGEYDTAGIGENIMGLGYKFEAINAAPWTRRLAKHTNTLANEWRISLRPIPPQQVSEKDRRASNKLKWIA